MAKRTIPKHLGPARQWKSTMRRRLRAAYIAASIASVGSAFNPEHGSEGRIGKALLLLKQEMYSCSVKKWGR